MADHKISDVPEKNEVRKTCFGTIDAFYAVVPMCLAEFLSFTVPRAVIPGMQAEAFGRNSYAVECATFAVQGVLSFFFCPIFGAASDAYGRRIPLAIAAAGALVPVCALLMGCGMTVYQILSALSGMAKGTLVVVFAYVADTLPQGPKRTTAFGVVMGTLGVALSVGPYLGSVVSQHRGDMAVFELTLALGMVAVAYAVCLLPETRDAEAAAASPTQTPNPLVVVKGVMADPYLRRVMLIALLYYISYWGLVSSVMLYLTRVLAYTVVERGRFLSLVGMYHMIAEFFVVRLCIRSGLRDKTLVQIGLVGWIAKLICLSLASERWMLDLVAMLSMVSALFNPALISLASSAAETRGTQGEVQGAVAAFRALAEGMGPLMMGILFSFCSSTTFPGLPYAVAAGVAVCALVMTFRLPEAECALTEVKTDQ